MDAAFIQTQQQYAVCAESKPRLSAWAREKTVTLCPSAPHKELHSWKPRDAESQGGIAARRIAQDVQCERGSHKPTKADSEEDGQMQEARTAQVTAPSSALSSPAGVGSTSSSEI